jgi:hypothetical protein
MPTKVSDFVAVQVMSRSGDECVVALTDWCHLRLPFCWSCATNPSISLLFAVLPQVMSRSGDECVVALTDQWYLYLLFPLPFEHHIYFSRCCAGDEPHW